MISADPTEKFYVLKELFNVPMSTLCGGRVYTAEEILLAVQEHLREGVPDHLRYEVGMSIARSNRFVMTRMVSLKTQCLSDLTLAIDPYTYSYSAAIVPSISYQLFSMKGLGANKSLLMEGELACGFLSRLIMNAPLSFILNEISFVQENELSLVEELFTARLQGVFDHTEQ